MFSGWGLRTLSTAMARYNPLSYHNGSVWPHDTAIAAAGLMRYGFVEQAEALIDALLDAAVANGGRLPELFAGLDRSQLPVPVAYPTSCSPQAWSSAAPLLMLRTLLRLEPDFARGTLRVDPVQRAGCLGDVTVHLAGAEVRIEVGARPARVSGLPEGVECAVGPQGSVGGHAAPPR
jgi:glycogen debranching enzyme